MWTLDDFPFNIDETDLGDADIVLFSTPGWQGPVTPETEAARIQGLRDAWEDAGDRRAEHAIRLKANRYEGPTHQHGMSAEHKANLSKALMGNQNARKKPKT